MKKEIKYVVLPDNLPKNLSDAEIIEAAKKVGELVAAQLTKEVGAIIPTGNPNASLDLKIYVEDA